MIKDRLKELIKFLDGPDIPEEFRMKMNQVCENIPEEFRMKMNQVCENMANDLSNSENERFIQQILLNNSSNEQVKAQGMQNTKRRIK